MEKIVKKTATAIVLILCAMFILRCCLAADKRTFSKLTATDALRSAYADGESEILTVARMESEIAGDGYFSAWGFYYCPETGEVQLAVRWNKSVYEYTDMEEGHEFSFHLVNETTGEEFPAEAIDEKQFAMYSYRKLTVSGVHVAEGEQLSAVMELRDGYTSVQVLKYDEQELVPYKVPKKTIEEVTGKK